MAGWGQGFFEGAGTLAGSIGEGLLAALRPDDPRDRNPTGLTSQQFAALQRGESVTPPARPGLGESLLAMTPLGAAKEAWKASDTAGEGGYEGGRATAAALGNLAMIAVPGGRGPGKGGGLPMDTASRLQRAREMGFGEGLPSRLYHGTNKDFRAFSLTPPGRATDAASAKVGVWADEDPALAAEYAEWAAKARAGGGGPTVYPLVGRADRKGRMKLRGDEDEHEVAATLMDAWGQGFDAVKVSNSITGQSSWVFKEPNQLRSPHAAFDPAKKLSSDLLAGVAGVAVPAAAVRGLLSKEQEQ